MKNLIVMSFGRFNPITCGHEKLIKKMLQLSSIRRKLGDNAYCQLFLSKSLDDNRNPLSISDRYQLLSNTYKDLHVSSALNPYVALEDVCKVGYHEIIFVVGEDRFEQYKTMKHYAEKWGCNNFSIVTAGKRNNRSRITGMSGTKMRQAVVDNNFKLFKSMVPEAFTEEKIITMWNLLSNKLRKDNETIED